MSIIKKGAGASKSILIFYPKIWDITTYFGNFF